jgi:3,4-dihydroxy 2-butanone 4-phosphate synthase/GTP cyclohydrolase II
MSKTQNDSILSPIEDAILELKNGKMIILVDDEDRENEGDLVVAAEKITPEHINFMARFGRGLICLAMSDEQLRRLQIPMMVKDNTSPFGTAFTVSIEAASGVTTGISAADRARTIQVASDPKSGPIDVVMPGHIFHLRAKEGGVLVRAGQTEGSVDLARLAGLEPAGVICEIMNDDGSMSRLKDLIPYAKEHNLKIVSVADLIKYRMKNECLVREIASSKLPLEPHGEFTMKVFESVLDGAQHVALVHGEISSDRPTLVRAHSECLTGDAFGSMRCDCGAQLQASLSMIGKEGGVLLYMRQEGRGIGLANKIRAYELQDGGLDTVEANRKLGFNEDHRDYGIGSQILKYLGVSEMKLLTNNPRKIYGLDGFGLKIVERLPIEMAPNQKNLNYLTTKRDKMGHLLTLN